VVVNSWCILPLLKVKKGFQSGFGMKRPMGVLMISIAEVLQAIDFGSP